MVNDITTSKKRRKDRKERIIFFIKLIVYIVLVYFNVNQPDFYAHFKWLSKVTGALTFFLGANLVISLMWLIVLSWYIRKHHLKENMQDNFVLGINRITSVMNTVCFFLAVMIFFGIDPLQFLTSITIVAAAIALLFKDYITNMINGLIIMFSDQLSLGDHIKVGDLHGKILDITLVNVVIQNDDDDIVLVPNSIIFTSLIINQSKQNIRKLSLEFELDLKYQYSPDMLEQRLKSVLSPFKDSVKESSFSLKTLEIKKDMVRFKIQLQMPRLDRDVERRIRRALNTEIMRLSVKEA